MNLAEKNIREHEKEIREPAGTNLDCGTQNIELQ